MMDTDDEFDRLMASNDQSLRKFLNDVDDDVNNAVANVVSDQNPDNDDVSVDVPQDFPFPFTPYGIQLDFMRKLYETIELGKIGIFESPTGTGKSLSLLCGSLLWLKNFEEKKQKELNNLLSNKKKPQKEIKEKGDDWISEYVKKQEQEERAQKLLEEQEMRRKREEKLKMLKFNIKSTTPKRKRDPLEEKFDELFSPDDPLKRKLTEVDENFPGNDDDSCDDDIVLTEYVSDNDDDGCSGKSDKKVDDVENSDSNDDDVIKEDHVMKIYYCSRTHSQLAQFVHEIRRSPYADDVKVTSLASRQSLCINVNVSKLKSLNAVNDKCLDMQKNKTSKNKNEASEPATKKSKSSASSSSSGGCPYYKHDKISEFTDRILVEVKDIEDLAVTGRELKACPYYATRRAIPSAQLVILPYNTILHKSTRESSGIKLDGNILIIDEGHNLIETIGSIHNIEVTGLQLSVAHSQLCQYRERYKKRLKAKNLMYIKQLIFIVANCIKMLGGKLGEEETKDTTNSPQKSIKKEKMTTINDFLFSTRLDNLNLFKIRRYCEKSLIAKKLQGFSAKFQGSVEIHDSRNKKLDTSVTSSWDLSSFLIDVNQKTAQETEKITNEKDEEAKEAKSYLSSPLHQIENFIEALTNTDKDGRIVVNKQDLLRNSTVKFLMLNPAVHFAEVVKKCRSVIIAGGTMEPLSDFKEQLFYSIGVKENQISEFSCGHIISRDKLIAIALARGSSGHELDFTYQNRESSETVKELGRVISNVCNVVPAGIVCFFPSYDYKASVVQSWKTNGFLAKIRAKKEIFSEPKSAGDVEKTLDEYSSFIVRHSTTTTTTSQQNGAILFCVVGGKMSEGINFSDDLGRCVIMVGLPYPNMHSAELKEKMEYLNANMPASADGKQPGRVHYENLCMKAVNQSIGRAIRHKNDHAAILLLDNRFLKQAVCSKLPSWIQGHLEKHERFGPAFKNLRKFFADKKTSNSSEDGSKFHDNDNSL